jgi:AsmA protein
MALDRPVDIGAVKIHILPQPGFDLENFVVYDDPAFSSEPMVRASEVSASLRVRSLLRGRLEVSRLSLADPSLNLVRSRDGHWNLENLIERAARTEAAPTATAQSERPAFPYVEADNARINFKLGTEKKPYALTEATLSFWQESENTWGMRLKARPVRTDFNLSDTGTLSLDGIWKRSASLRDTPLQFRIEWDKAQLGQFTTLVLGSDKGWRGALKIDATISGKPHSLQIVTDASISDFRRFDILGGNSVDLKTHCTAHYSSSDRSFSAIGCQSPVGAGLITVSGNITGFYGPTYDLALKAANVPVQSLATLARHAKKNLPDDLLADGTLDADMRAYREDSSGPVWSGRGHGVGVHLQSKSTGAEIVADEIPFSLDPSAKPSARKNHSRSVLAGYSELRLELGPFGVAMGRPNPVVVHGSFGRSGYDFSIAGESQLARLLQVARMMGLPSRQPAADGLAKIDLQLAGKWSGFAGPQPVGKMQLSGVRVEVRGVNAPLQVASATVQLDASEVRIRNLSASVDNLAWQGSFALPRPCIDVHDCPVQFDLHTPKISLEALEQLLDPHLPSKPWYKFLPFSSQADKPFLASVSASGRLAANQLQFGKIQDNGFSAEVTLSKGKLQVSEIHGEILGGQHHGDLTADFTVKPPLYAGKGKFDRLNMAGLAGLMHDGWATGTAQASYRFKTSGNSAADLLADTQADLQLEITNGSLPHITLPDNSGPLHLRRLDMQVAFRDGKFEIREGKLETSTGVYSLAGTASLGQRLDLRLVRDAAHAFSVTGTVEKPQVVPAAVKSETTAVLKQ